LDCEMAQAVDVNNVKTILKRLTNENLKRILREENLQVSGLKTALQGRMIECMFCFPGALRVDFSFISPPSSFFSLLQN